MLCLVFDSLPGPEAPRLIEVEDGSGHSVSAGEWRTRPDGLAELVIGEAKTGHSGAGAQSNGFNRIHQNNGSLGAIEIYCDNCHRYRPTELEAWDRAGEYEFADRICSVCCWIIAVLRRPAQS